MNDDAHHYNIIPSFAYSIVFKKIVTIVFESQQIILLQYCVHQHHKKPQINYYRRNGKQTLGLSFYSGFLIIIYKYSW